MSLADDLESLFDVDRRAQAAEVAVLAHEAVELAHGLADAVSTALKESGDDAELRLRRLTDLCAQVEGPEMADALLAILDHPTPSIRTEAGEALLDVAYARFKEVALAIERRLETSDTGAAMQELPFVLIQVRDPDPLPLLAKFLAHPEPDVVGASIEALASYGDPNAAPHLEALLEDTRETTLEDLDDAPVRLGELAEAALEELGIEA
ncbi:MAG: HEAT repeat domain-containing protein [Sandaracinaceae bacterium]